MALSYDASPSAFDRSSRKGANFGIATRRRRSVTLVASNVLQLRPRLKPVEEAIEAYRAARPAECLMLLHGHVGLDAEMLRARAHLRVGRPDLALAGLATLDETELYNGPRGELLTLRGAALTLDHRFEDARETLNDARVYVYGFPSDALEAEYHNVEALWSMAGPDFESMDRAALAALATEPAIMGNQHYFVPLANSRARALQMRGLVAAGREHYMRQLGFIRQAIAEMAASETPDLWVSASLAMHLAFHVRDFDLQADAVSLRALPLDTWPQELAAMRYNVLRSLGWSSALRGDHLDAFRAFRHAGQSASSSAWKIIAATDRAYLANELGEPSMVVQDEVEHAADLAKRVDWENSGEERIGLAFLAARLASFSPVRGREIFDRYGRIRAKLAPHVLARFDRRPRADELFAEGMVLAAEGSAAGATRCFFDAYEIWDALDYRWLAATAAIELAELGGGDRFASALAREAAHRPHSWLARRVALLR